MFWGLIMESNKRYSQTVKKAFHISMAALDAQSSSDEAVQVMCMFENKKYLLCSLQKDTMIQAALDLNFDVGDSISFVTNGKANVHLTGYLADDILDDDSLDDEDSDMEVAGPIEKVHPKNIVSTKRRIKPPTSSESSPSKKSKIVKTVNDLNSQDEDDSDDPEFHFSDLPTDEDSIMSDEELDEEESEEDEDIEEGNNSEDEDDNEIIDESMEEEEEDDSDGLTDDESEEEEKTVKPKMNGTSSKKSKNEGAPQKKEEKEPKTPNLEKKAAQNQKSASKQKKVIEGGVTVEDIVVGDGQIAKPGKMVQVYYEGRLKSNNKVFDSSLKGVGFKFRLGKQEVIKGWDVGVNGMKVGGKRRVTCPPSMAYGQKGSPPTIPPNSTLVFEIMLKNVH